MKEIKLHNGLIALVDDEDAERVSQHNQNWTWTKSGAWARSSLILDKFGNKQKVSMHRVVLNYHDRNLNDVDHIDRNNLNNQKNNLRIVAHKDNVLNSAKGEWDKKLTSTYKGVSWHKKSGKWQVHFCKNGKRYYGGLFDNELDAAKCANKFVVMLAPKTGFLNKV